MSSARRTAWKPARFHVRLEVGSGVEQQLGEERLGERGRGVAQQHVAGAAELVEAADPVELDQRLEDLIDLQRIDSDRLGDVVGGAATPAIALRRIELRDDDEREMEVGARCVGPASDFPADQRRIGGDHRAEQDDHPGEVDPDQEDRQRREGAVDHRVGRYCTEVRRQRALARDHAGRDEEAADQRMRQRTWVFGT